VVLQGRLASLGAGPVQLRAILACPRGRGVAGREEHGDGQHVQRFSLDVVQVGGVQHAGELDVLAEFDGYRRGLSARTFETLDPQRRVYCVEGGNVRRRLRPFPIEVAG
jgi:hypothetical protein